jgi:leucine dehydrogenase
LFRDPNTGVSGAVAIHSTTLGPAVGGLRILSYSGLKDAAVDALGLSRAMTLKNAAAGLRYGGGKAVLIDDGRWEDRNARLLAFADVVERLGGDYVTAEDIGTTPEDMDVLATRTRWVAGRSLGAGGAGDPSPSTARTVAGAIEAAVRSVFERESLEGIRIGVIGAGKVGARLASLVAAAGAYLTIADIDRPRAEACAASTPNASAVPLHGFLARKLDVLAPCARGGLIGASDVPGLDCRIVAGAANNPLVDRAAAVALHDSGILYVPDFIANCGGIIHVSAELDGLDAVQLEARLAQCAERAERLLEDARRMRCPPLDLAVERALRRVRRARGTTDPDGLTRFSRDQHPRDPPDHPAKRGDAGHT